MRDDVVALYVDPRGPYPTLVREWYDEARDARTYAGPLPVVAHPPCGPWGRLHHMSKHQPKWAGPHAVERVRALGGVLEHPSNSKLWRACNMPFPGELPDAWGGYTIEVRQVDWGHPCVKPTWLYLAGIARSLADSGVRSGGVPTHRLTNGPRGVSARTDMPRATAMQCRATPPEFAEWLIDLAASARKAVAA